MIKRCDVLVVGGGIAGLYASVLVDPSLKVTLLSKVVVDESSSYLAQGGIAAAIDEEDRPEYHFDDTLIAGSGLCDMDALNVLVSEAADNIKKLCEIGVIFDRENGRFSLTREGGHSRSRILHVDGDTTGRGIIRELAAAASRLNNVTVVNNGFCIDLLTLDGRCIGVVALEGDEVNYYLARSVVLATGGIGSVYGITTNPLASTGDAIAMGSRAGVEIKDMEFIQFHPTAFHNTEKKRFLISEAVRGEGAVLRNINGRRFMRYYDRRLELAPRDVVSRAIIKEMKKTRSDHVFLDMTHLKKEHILRRFPNIYRRCMEYGVDAMHQYIPVAPAQHYCMGGIKTDLFAHSSLPGLYVCGEAACTGVHGANRLASNSLLEAVVFAKRAVDSIHSDISAFDPAAVPDGGFPVLHVTEHFDVAAEKEAIQSLMMEHVGIVRTQNGLLEAHAGLLALKNKLEDHYVINRDYLECLNMLETGIIITEYALRRKESIGAHYLLA